MRLCNHKNFNYIDASVYFVINFFHYCVPMSCEMFLMPRVINE